MPRKKVYLETNIAAPSFDQNCEVCKIKAPPVLFDARVRKGEYGARGHWIYMCPVCHIKHGIGYDSDSIIVYQKFASRYFEVRKEFELDIASIRSAVMNFRQESSREEEWKIFLLGEIAIQLAVSNNQQKEMNEYLKSLTEKTITNVEDVNPTLPKIDFFGDSNE